MGRSDTHDQICKILESVDIHSTAEFTFAGRRFVTPGDTNAPETRAAAIELLTEELYRNCFCARFSGELHERSVAADSTSLLSTELSAANQAKSRWSEGWKIIAVEERGRIFAQKAGAVRSFWPGEYVVPDLARNAPMMGTSVRVNVATESLTAQPGFYFAFGESLEDRQEGLEIVRFYWSVSDAGVVPLFRRLTRDLNRYVVPYRLKCPTDRSQYWRLDAAVLYVERRFYRITAELLFDVYERTCSEMRTISPLFTKPLAPGLGLAENPSNGASFGLHRCGLLARSLIEGFESRASGNALLPTVEKRFESQGLSLIKPYLNPASTDDYDFGDSSQLR